MDSVANERLRQAIDDAGLRLEDVAREVGIKARTVEGWIAHDRVPSQANRRQVARLVDVDELDLWPQHAPRRPGQAVGEPELVHIYSARAEVPSNRWQELLESARESIDVLVYGGLFLPDPDADLPGILERKAEEGVEIRLLYGHPDSRAVARRGAEEGMGDALAARIRLALSYLRPVLDAPGIEVRLHATTLYNSIYRYDDELLVNTHAHGIPAADCPILHVRRLGSGRLFDHYMASFERVWEDATHVAVPQGAEAVGALA